MLFNQGDQVKDKMYFCCCFLLDVVVENRLLALDESKE